MQKRKVAHDRLAVMQRQADGRWLMIRDTWNSDRPPPVPAPAEAPAAEAGAPAG